MFLFINELFELRQLIDQVDFVFSQLWYFILQVWILLHHIVILFLYCFKFAVILSELLLHR